MEFEEKVATKLKLKGYSLIQQLTNNLYQYRACDNIKELVYICKNIWLDCLYATVPADMNDPFDSTISFSESDMMQKYLRNLNPEKYADTPIDLTKISNQERTMCTDMCNHFKKILNEIKSSLFVTCLTSSGWNNPLMWAHYAKSYYGVCIEYDKDTIDLDTCLFNQMTYVYEKPLLSFLTDLDLNLGDGPEAEEILLDDVLEQLYTKEQSWSYEREYRLIQSHPTNNGMSYTYIPLDVKSVTVGLKCNPIYRNILLMLCKYKNLPCFKLKTEFDSYNLKRQDINEDSITYDDQTLKICIEILNRVLEKYDKMFNIDINSELKDINQLLDDSLYENICDIESKLDTLLFELCFIFCFQCLLRQIFNNKPHYKIESKQVEKIYIFIDATDQFKSDILDTLLKKLEDEFQSMPLPDMMHDVYQSTIRITSRILDLVHLLQTLWKTISVS